MTDTEVYEPIERYRDELRELHERNTAELFESLVVDSGVDEESNVRLVAEIRELDQRLGEAERKVASLRTLRGFIIFLAVVGIIACGVALYMFLESHNRDADISTLGIALLAAIASVGFFTLNHRKVGPSLRKASSARDDLNEQLQERTTEAWTQMEPLNRLYDWDMAARLCSQTLPTIAFDPFFTRGRLDELVEIFGWDHSFNKNRSILYSQSGTIGGNPFVLAETLDFAMASKTYTGTLQISWTERVRDSKGNVQTVTRYQTLHASVTKPAPRYSRNKLLIYGNEAAPALYFNRTPSDISSLGDGPTYRRRLKSKIKELEKFSRNLDDDSGFTLMANKEFDALFGAKDRNNEVQFRMLFTPLAQQNMLKLLKDREVGFGDDFDFLKNQMINFVRPQHLQGAEISGDPQTFHNFDLNAARRTFNQYHNDYFRTLYFAFAPLLAIPLYQFHRPHHDIYREVYGRNRAFWEHESIANFHGQSDFAHPESVTDNLLKTRLLNTRGQTETVEVTARGFSSHERLDYVSTWGRDGRLHNVPVYWTEYLPAIRKSELVVHGSADATSHKFEQEFLGSDESERLLARYGQSPEETLFRRSLVSFLPRR